MAYSGGRDSTALLHATLKAADALGVRVAALHVHHGLNASADTWLEHCETQCRRWRRRHPNLAFAAVRLEGRPTRGDSVEAWARRERYRALSAMARAQGASLVLLAHHRRDQAETLLLQALRGAGVAGQSAMPRSATRDGLRWARPWLEQPATAVAAYARRHRLAFVDDDSNADARFARSRLRHQVWPALVAAFPDAERALAQAARRAQQAREAADEQTEADLARVAEPRGLVLAQWRALSPARRVQALRAWLAQQLGSVVPASLLERLADEADRPGAAEWPVSDRSLTLRRHRGVLRIVAATPATPATAVETVLRVARAGVYRIPGWTGSLHVERVTEGGVALDRLRTMRARARRGGEQFQLGARRPPRALKKQYQSLGIAAHERTGPLLFVGDELLFAPGLGVDARLRAAAGVAQVALRWVEEAGSPSSES